MKKRVLALMLVLGMTFSLAACGSSNDKKSDDTKTETTDKDSKEKMTTVKWNYGSSGNVLVTIAEEEGYFEVTTEYTEFQTVLENLKNAGYQYEEAEISMIPENTVEITDLETAKKVMALYDALEDLDDSQNVYSNFDIPDEILEQLD